MAEAPNILAQGAVDTTDETVYTVPASTSAIVTVIVVNTTSGTPVTGVQIYVNGLLTNNTVVPPIDLDGHESLKYGPIALGTGDSIGIGCATGDDVASYTVEGIEFT